MSNATEERKENCLIWALKVRKFNKERKKLIKCYQKNPESIWADILERIHVRSFDRKYIRNPTLMPAQYFVPGFCTYKDGTPIETYECQAGSLSQIFIYSLKIAGFYDQQIPRRIRKLLQILD